jgi:exodeoxyribonuclease VII large subunit
MEESGKGALQARFEELKERLRKEGLFDEARKKSLPLLPRHVGIVTSKSGAAIRDILNILSRRFGNLHIVIVDVRVQGAGAAEEIAAGIDLLNEAGVVEVMIVGRGGGSLEDLWCFNEEVVARAICRSKIPVISAVGHEIDFTISDFAADLRAPTPSAAAELVVGRKDDFVARINELARLLSRSLRESLLERRGRFNALVSNYVMKEPAHLVRRYRERLGTARIAMIHHLTGAMREIHQRFDDCGLKLAYELKNHHQVAVQKLKGYASHLNALNPLAVLGRGYSITRDGNGKIIRAADEVAKGQELYTILGKGKVASTVVEAEL